MWTYTYSNELRHHGIKGQKWGIRRYQNTNGTLTAEGKMRYGADSRENMYGRGSRKYYKDTMGNRAGVREYRDREYMSSSAYMARKRNEVLKEKYDKLSSKQRVSKASENVKKTERLQRKMDKVKKYMDRNKSIDTAVKDVLTKAEYNNGLQAARKQAMKSAFAYSVLYNGGAGFTIGYAIAKQKQDERVRVRLGLPDA